jgi:hypothetical protein
LKNADRTNVSSGISITKLRRHLAILFLPLVISFLSVSQLVKDFRDEYRGAFGGFEMGKANQSIGDVKRRQSTRFRWFPVEDGQKLYLGDSVRTLQDSEVHIELGDGTKLDMNSNSLIVLQKSEGQTQVQMLYGDLSFKGGSQGFFLQIGNQILEVSDAQGAVSQKDGFTQIQVKEGKIKVNVDGKLQEIGRRTEVQILPNQSARILDLAYEPLEPKPHAIIMIPALPVGSILLPTHSEKHAVQFAWRSSQAILGAALEISKLRDFSKLELRVPVTSSGTKVPLLSGKYFWRLTAQGRAISEARFFQLEKRLPLQLTSPLEGEVISLDGSSKVLLQWLGAPYSDHYLVEVATDSEFKKIVFTENKKRQTTSFFYTRRMGKFYWRVKSWSDRDMTLVENSPVQTFSLKLREKSPDRSPDRSKDRTQEKSFSTSPVTQKATSPTAATPTPIHSATPQPSPPAVSTRAPAAVAQAPLGKLIWAKPKSGAQFQVVAHATQIEVPVEFEWKLAGEPSEVFLKIQKQKHSTEASSLGKDTSEEGFQQKIVLSKGWGKYLWRAEAPGRYSWEIVDVNGNVLNLEKEKTPEFDVSPAANCLQMEQPQVEYAKNRSKVNFQLNWTAIPGSRSYWVSLYSGYSGHAGSSGSPGNSSSRSIQKKEPILRKEVTDSSFSLDLSTLKVNQFYYQVTTELSSGFKVSSPMQAFQVKFETPRLVKPLANATISKQALAKSRQSSILMTWQKTSFSEAFVFEISRYANFSKVHLSKQLTLNYFFLPVDQFKPGTYWWRVRGTSKTIVSPPSPANKLFIKP